MTKLQHPQEIGLDRQSDNCDIFHEFQLSRFKKEIHVVLKLDVTSAILPARQSCPIRNVMSLLAIIFCTYLISSNRSLSSLFFFFAALSKL